MEAGDIIRERYQIERVLGWGNMGTTYKAFDLKTRHIVAVKQLHLMRMKMWKTLEMFEREAKILQQLDHPNIPSYIEYFSLDMPSDVEFLLVQEYIEGKTLQQLVEEGWRGTETEILEIFQQLVAILSYLHSLRPPVIHRDINPKNIIFSPTRKVNLVDFGAVQEKIRTTVFGGSTIVGTFGYVPFEQFTGRAVPASDYYALGATLLYLFTHRHPVDFPTENLKPKFHPFLQASPKIFRLLDKLLEPSVQKRLNSPEQVTSLLEKSDKETPTANKISVSKPFGTKIKKIIKKPHHVCFHVPAKNSRGKRTLLLIGSIGHLGLATMLVSPGVPLLYFFSIPCWVLSGVAFWLWMKGTFGHILLDLSPEHVTIHQKCFGLGYSRKLPTVSLRPSDVTYHFEKKEPVLGINHAGKTLEIGSRLLLRNTEVEWLIQEIKAYISMYGTSSPKK